MKKNIIILALLLVGLLQPHQMMAQEKKNAKTIKKELKAQVVDEKGNPLSGVLVSANEGADQTKTNDLGDFTIKVKEASFLVFEVVGYDNVSMSVRQIGANANKIALKPLKDVRTNAVVRLPFQSMSKTRTTGNISVVDAISSMSNDSRIEVGAHLSGKVTGAFGNWNFHGLGNAVTVVDGVIRDVTYLNMQEIEQITVLKDAYSRMLYGADADAPVILVTTKSGAKFKKVLNFNIEQGFTSAISKPKFLDAAAYMETYNKAYKNDGMGAAYYRQGVIDSTRMGIDPVLFPNNDYRSSQYVNNSSNFTNVYGEASGGNERVQYLMNIGWKHNNGWLALSDDITDKFNLRGKVDFEVTDWLKMKADIVAIFDIYRGPQTNTFYADAAKLLPNAFPLLIPNNRILNDSTLAGKNPIGNSLLGGTSVYQQNLYGDMTRGGRRTDMNRFLQYMVGFDIDLKKVTKGLTLSGLVDLDFYNYYSQFLDNNYAVYKIDSIKPEGNFKVSKIGEDVFTNKQTVNNDNSSFNRSYNGYLTANYNRSFGKHQVSAVALAYYNQTVANNVNQDVKRLRFGTQLNYTYDDTYIVEAGLLREGSNKLNPANGRFRNAPSVGAGWVVSNEDFMKDNSIFDYLKLRGTYGVLYNDNWVLGNYNGYYLYEQSYTRGGNFTYNNTSSANTTIDIISLANIYDMQKRTEFVGGFDSYLFNKKLWVEASYWNSLSSGNMVIIKNNAPSTMGLAPISNFNATRYQGIELGVNYKENFGNLKMDLGLTYLYSTSAITEWEEPIYADNNKHLSRIGKDASSLWGLKSAGLYSTDDFQTDGVTLIDGLEKPSYGVVRPGDIKYEDKNKDGKINADDQSVIGLGGNNQQIALNLNFEYKNWQLFVLGIGSYGGKGLKSSNYYWFKGNEAKYSEEALKAFDPENPNPAAEYPRLSLGNGNNNYINSTFWLYDRSSISLSNVQLSYNVQFAPTASVKSMKIFARGSNLLTLGKDVEILQLNWNSAPQSRLVSLGLIANF